MDYVIQDETSKISQMMYNHTLQKLFVGTSGGNLYSISKEATSNEEEEEDKDDKKDEEVNFHNSNN